MIQNLPQIVLVLKLWLQEELLHQIVSQIPDAFCLHNQLDLAVEILYLIIWKLVPYQWLAGPYKVVLVLLTIHSL